MWWNFFFCTFWFLSSRGFGLRPKMCRQRKFPLHARKTSSTQGIGPLKIQKNTGLLIFNSLKQKKLIFNFFVNRNWKKLTDSRKRAKILADNRKRHHPIETLLSATTRNICLVKSQNSGLINSDKFCSRITICTDRSQFERSVKDKLKPRGHSLIWP